MKLLAWLVYIPLQIVWLPLSIIGASWTGYKQIARSKALGLSQTAIEIINGRWTADVFGLRKDRASRKLAGKLPNNSVFGLFLALFPLLVARWIAGSPILYPVRPPDEKAGIANLVFSRTPRFDELIASHAAEAKQFVVLGAGLDTRAYGELADAGLAIFELDLPNTQQMKRKALARAKIKSEHVRYIEVDFADSDWINPLLASEYDPSVKTIFLWEGVTLYLSEDDVRKTLATLKANAGPGSVVLLDIYGQRMLDFASKGPQAKTLEATSESLTFGLSPLDGDALGEFAQSNGYELGQHYLFGSAHKKGAYMSVAEFKV